MTPSAKKVRGEKKTYHHENLKESLIQEALLFLRNGRAEDLSLRDLSRRLRVSHMAPYRHFASKEDLLAEIIKNGFRSLTSRFRKIEFKAAKDFEVAFARHSQAYIEFVLESPDHARLMFSGLLNDPKKYISAHQAGQEAFLRLLELIQFGQKCGRIRKNDDPMMVGLMVWSAVHGSAMLMIENQFSKIDNAPSVKLDVYNRFMSQRILKGLK
jgi:AcrR family transcriptional regulator